MNFNRLRQLATLAATAAAFGVLTPASSHAAETAAPPTHLTAYNLAWLNYIAPEDLPAAPYATCIVDSGVLITPDTPEASATGPILERLATDGGPGTPQGQAPEQLHGTRMAMAAIAPANDWGTIGATTWGRVVSVRAQVDNQLEFAQDAYRKGISQCRVAAARSAVATVSLSLGCDCDLSDDERARLEDAIARAHQDGLSVVASAGNRPGQPTGTPARYDGVFAAAAGTPAGDLCSYASADATVDVVGPACPVDTADPLTGAPFSDWGGGSSTAAATTGAFLTALRSLTPGSTAEQVETWVRDSARPVAGYRALDGEAAARLAGLGDLVDRAKARMPTAPPPAATPTQQNLVATPPMPTSSPEPAATDEPEPVGSPPFKRTRFKAPRGVRVTWRNRRVSVFARSRPRAARLQVLVEQLGGDFGLAERQRRASAAADKLSMPVKWRPDRVTVRFVAKREFGLRASKTRILHRSRSGRFR